MSSLRGETRSARESSGVQLVWNCFRKKLQAFWNLIQLKTSLCMYLITPFHPPWFPIYTLLSVSASRLHLLPDLPA